VIRVDTGFAASRVARACSEIGGNALTGRAAAGKSHEAWMKKYWEKRAKREKNIADQSGSAGVSSTSQIVTAKKTGVNGSRLHQQPGRG
jgi:hypothetical protein